MIRSFLNSAGVRKLSTLNGPKDANKIVQAFGFELSDEQKSIQETARKFTREEIIPKAAYHDRTGEFPLEITKKAFQVGLMNIVIPTEYGGPGLSWFDADVIAEELCYGCAGIGLPLSINALPSKFDLAHFLAVGGNRSSEEEVLRKNDGGAIISEAYAVTEPTGGSDVAAVKTQAEKKGNQYILNGVKMWITNAGVANWFFVLARTAADPKALSKHAFTGFVVEADTPGVKVGRKEMMMGQRASDTRGITFEDVVLTKDNVIGEEGKGFQISMESFDASRPLIAAAATGLAQRALDEALRYSLERSAFGRKIIEHQAVAFMLADMAIGVENSRISWMKAAWEQSMGMKSSYSASIAKAYASDVANKCAADAVQILGGNGYSQEYPVEKLMRDAKIFQIYEGTSQIQRVIISRELVARLQQR